MNKGKIKALANYLDIKTSDIEVSGYNEYTFKIDESEYMVLTDSEADERAREYILNSVWAFNTDFLMSHMPDGIDEEILKMAQEKCEGANETFKAMIRDLEHFIEDAISADGRGHFMSSYDGEEVEEGEYFIYRTN